MLTKRIFVHQDSKWKLRLKPFLSRRKFADVKIPNPDSGHNFPWSYRARLPEEFSHREFKNSQKT